MKLAITSTLVLFAVLATFTGCGATDKIDNRIDCHGICGRYKDCFDSSYDTSGCVDRCENNSDKTSEFMSKVDACDSCIGDKSCAGATFNCATDCAGVVP